MKMKLLQLIEEKNFTELENLWVDLLENNEVSTQELLEIADQLRKIGESARGFMLLEILANHLENQNKFDEAIAVYKHLPYFTENDRSISMKLVDLYKKQYNNNARIEKLIELSGIEKSEHIFRSIEKLEEFLRFEVGNLCYFERYGTGEIVLMNPEKKELVIDFEEKKGYVVKFEVARGILKPISQSHFLYKKYHAIEELKKRLSEDPVALLKYLLKSFNEQLSSSEIKTHLRGVVPDTEIDKFWEKMRKKLERDDCIKVETVKGQKTYQFIAEGIDKNKQLIESFRKADMNTKVTLAEKYMKEYPQIFYQLLPELVNLANEKYKNEPAYATDIFYLCSKCEHQKDLKYTLEELLQLSSYERIIHNLLSYEHQREILKKIQERESDRWQEIFHNILLATEDIRLMEEIEKELRSKGNDTGGIFQSILLMPERFPAQIKWILRKFMQGELGDSFTPAILIRLIKSLETAKSNKALLLKAFTLEKFDEFIRLAKKLEVTQLKEAIINSTTLKDYEKNDYLRIIDFHYPDMQKQNQDVIYASYDALIRKKKELEYLLTVEIPKNKEEISRAREYGDLSENFEYKAAREKQDQLYQRVRDLENEIQRVKLIDFSNVDTTKVSPGTKVILKDLTNGELIEYTILGRWETDLQNNIISNESPVAKDHLLNKHLGDNAVIDGRNFEIIGIEKLDRTK